MYAGVCLYTFGLSKTGNAFYFSRFSLTKRMVQGGEATSERRRRDGVSGKSHIRGLSTLSRRRQPTHGVHWFIPPLKKLLPRARVSRASHAWRVSAANIKKLKSVVLRSPQLHATTRANIPHEKAEQIRARIVCTPAESAGMDRFAKQMRSASPRQGKRA